MKSHKNTNGLVVEQVCYRVSASDFYTPFTFNHLILMKHCRLISRLFLVYKFFADGFPTLEGNAENVDGKNFEVRKVDDVPATDAVRSSVRDFCQMLVAAINKYYAFGSCFVDDAT